MESNKEENITSVSEENIYKLNGRVPLRKAIPFGLQHFKIAKLALMPFGSVVHDSIV